MRAAGLKRSKGGGARVGCILDVPFRYVEAADGGHFMSRDVYGHRCQVNGAVWNLGGRNFDGTDDSVNCGNNAVFDLTTAFALSASISPKDITTYRRIVSKFGEPGLPWIFTVSAARRLDIQVRPGPATRSSATTLATGDHTEPILVACAYEGSAGRLDVSINGNPDNGELVGSIPASLNVDNTDVLIGSAVTSPYPMRGLILEVRIYSRAEYAAKILQRAIRSRTN